MGEKAGETREDNSLKMKLVWCPPGQFKGGKVTLTQGFWIGKTELTQGQWEAVMKTTPWKGKRSTKVGSTYPATYVSWKDAMSFCRKLSDQEQKAGRLPKDWEYTLPTEAQWEYACRAGTTTRFSFGSGRDWATYAWFDRDGGYFPTYFPVGQLKPNPWGLLDMHGNASEWCRDSFARKAATGPDPEAKVNNGQHVVRGGHAGQYFGYGESGNHGIGIRTDTRSRTIGFRVILRAR